MDININILLLRSHHLNLFLADRAQQQQVHEFDPKFIHQLFFLVLLSGKYCRELYPQCLLVMSDFHEVLEFLLLNLYEFAIHLQQSFFHDRHQN